MSLDLFKNVMNKMCYKSYISNFYVQKGFGIQKPSMVDRP